MAEEIPQAQIEKDEARKRYEFKKALEKLEEKFRRTNRSMT